MTGTYRGLSASTLGVLTRKTSVLTIPRCLVSDPLALMHYQHGHPGPVAAAPMYTLMDRRQTVIASGISWWKYRGKYLDGASSDWSKEAVLDSFTP